MPKKIKKRDVEQVVENKIEDYVNSFENVNTQVSYRTALNQIKNLESLTPEELWNLVESNGKSTDEKRRVQYIIKGYLKHYKTPFDIFEKNLKKVEVNGKYIHNCDNLEEPEAAQVKKKVKTVPTLSELEQIKENVKTIENKEHRLLFNLLTNYPVLRNDLALVRIRKPKEKEPRVNFKKNTIVFPEINKTKS